MILPEILLDGEKVLASRNLVLGTRAQMDPLFTRPYVDVDEWRDKPVRHRYVHGGFEGTECRFSFYFPPPERYGGRFFQPLMAVTGIESAATLPEMPGFMIPNTLIFALESGGYLVESNQGSTTMFPPEDRTIIWRSSAAAARFSREIALEMYGEHRPYGYVYGGSGGSLKAIACFENCPDVWDGAVAFVMATPMSMPNNFTVMAHAIRVLRNKFPAIVDALEPGGSGDMYNGLTVEEREALAEATCMGFPPRAWFNVERIAFAYTGVFSALIDNIAKWDSEYFNDFWGVPGYLGADLPDSLKRARTQHKTKIKKIITREDAVELGLRLTMPALLADVKVNLPVALQLESVPDGSLQGATITLLSGDAVGARLHVAGSFGDLVLIGFGAEHFQALTKIKAGDEVEIDNSMYLAVQTYHRHQVPSPDYYVWDQFRIAGKPVYPQRPILLGPLYTWDACGAIPTGRFAGKMIVVQTLMDEAAFPWHADWYRRLVEATFGPRLDGHFRVWFIDNAMHTSPVVLPGEPRPVITTRVISYIGVVEQALRDLCAWVERGLPPPASTSYKVVDGQVVVPPTATERKGVQPVVTVKVNGGECAVVSVGEPVEFSAVIEVPPSAGFVIAAEWDFEGTGEFPVVENVDTPRTHMTLKRTYTFSNPGTYFPALRVTSHRQGDFRARVARIQNIGRVRVIVK